MRDKLVLRELALSDESAFLAGVDSWVGEDSSWHSFDWKPGMAFEDLLDRLGKNSMGVDIPQGFVPSTSLYGFVDGNIVGRVHVRHSLNGGLKKRGGHIGYAVAPKFRGNGYAKEMVRQCLPACVKVGIEKLLVTCASGNVPSCKIIEGQGGILVEEVYEKTDKEMLRKYWIFLGR